MQRKKGKALQQRLSMLPQEVDDPLLQRDTVEEEKAMT